MTGKRGYRAQLADLSDAKLAEARELFAAGRSHAVIAEHLGISIATAGTFLGGGKEAMTAEELRTYRSPTPEDTRSFNARPLGAPPPGRSALETREPEIGEADRKRARRVGVSPWLYRALAAGPQFDSTSGLRAVKSQKFNAGT